MENIDRKFNIMAVNPVNGKTYSERDALLLCAKDAAVPAALKAYVDECERIGCDEDHIRSFKMLIDRVEKYQAEIEKRVPDTVGAELARCIDGIGCDVDHGNVWLVQDTEMEGYFTGMFKGGLPVFGQKDGAERYESERLAKLAITAFDLPNSVPVKEEQKKTFGSAVR